MIRPFFIALAIVFLTSCKQENNILSAQEIIDASMLASGASKVGNSKITFDFRKKHYVATRNKGRFSLEKITTNSKGELKDVLSNNGFKRYQNETLVIVPDSMSTSYAGSVNSVHYFAVLPYGLNDPAVKKKLLKETTIKGEAYYKIEIRFSEDGGGEDFDDIFVYWVHKKNFNIDYLAYSFHVNGGGKRFRQATNERVVHGIRFVDYNNYKPTNATTSLDNLDVAFENKRLEKISEIALINVKVQSL